MDIGKGSTIAEKGENSFNTFKILYKYLFNCFQLDVRHETIIHVPRDLTSGVIMNIPPYGFQILDVRQEAIIHVPRDPTSSFQLDVRNMERSFKYRVI